MIDDDTRAVQRRTDFGLTGSLVYGYAESMNQGVVLARETHTMNSSASSELPERSRGEILIALAVFASACLFVWPLRNYVSFNADEGITLVYAERILRGQVPYRDFFTFVTPGSPYFMALWFKLFGTSYVVARSVLIGYAGIFAAITYLLTRRGYGRTTALFAALLMLGCMPVRFLVLHNWDSTLFALLAIYCAQRVLESSSRLGCFFVGFTTALTLLTEQSKGAGLLLGLGIAAAVLFFQTRNEWRDSVGKLCSAAAGFTIPTALTVGYFASQHAITAMFEDWFWPMRHYSAVNRVPYGFLAASGDSLQEMYTSGPLSERIFVIIFSSPMFLISALALLVVVVTFYTLVVRWKTGPSKTLDMRVLGGCTYFGIFLSTLATGRPDMSHLVYLMPLFAYLVPSILDVKHRSTAALYRVRPIIAGLLLLSFTSFGMASLLKARNPAAKIETHRDELGSYISDEVIRYVQNNITPGQHLYIHPYQPLYYFLTETVNPTRYDFLQSGMSPAEQYQSAIHDLTTDRTSAVLLNPDFAEKASIIWPSTPLRALNGDPLLNYILQHYHSCRFLNPNPPHLWSFYYMVRKDLPCPRDHSSVGGQ